MLLVASGLPWAATIGADCSEGWIALKRNRYGRLIYKQLPDDVRRRVMEEVTARVNSEFIADPRTS